MNKVILMGRLTRDPEVRYGQGENASAVARYTLAVDRRYQRDGDQSADFINCVTFGKSAEFAEKYLRKGTKLVVIGRIQTGSYTNKDGQKVYTTDVIVEEQEFAESKSSQNNGNNGGNQNGYQNNNGNQGSYQNGYQNNGGNQSGYQNNGGNNNGNYGGYQNNGYQNQAPQQQNPNAGYQNQTPPAGFMNPPSNDGFDDYGFDQGADGELPFN